MAEEPVQVASGEHEELIEMNRPLHLPNIPGCVLGFAAAGSGIGSVIGTCFTPLIYPPLPPGEGTYYERGMAMYGGTIRGIEVGVILGAVAGVVYALRTRQSRLRRMAASSAASGDFAQMLKSSHDAERSETRRQLWLGIVAAIFSSVAVITAWSFMLVPARQSGSPVSLKSLVLHDVQGLFGGRVLWVTENRTAIIELVGKPPEGNTGLWVKRYKTILSDDQWHTVERLVEAHHLLSLEIPDRAGHPDEARPSISLVTIDQKSAKISKWANDKNSNFDPLYNHLLRLCHLTGKPFYEGSYDWNWHPEGFQQLE